MKQKRSARIGAVLLTLCMLAGLAVPTTAFAADGDSGNTNAEGIELAKTTELQADGTYTINLEAYATGEVKTITTEVGVPCDIVMVMDLSGSMKDKLTSGSSSTSKLGALKTAAKGFVDQVKQNATENNVDHRIGLVTFSSGNSSGSGDNCNTAWQNTGIYNGTDRIKYAQTSRATTSDITGAQYQAALVPADTASLVTAIDDMSYGGATFPNYGFEMAEGILENREITTYEKPDGTTGNRKQIVVFFTDGYPGKSVNEYNDVFSSDSDYNNIDTANRAITEADKLKENGATVFSVAVLNGADPATDYNFTVSGNRTTTYKTGVQAANAFLHYVSSDFKKAVSMTAPDRSTVVNNGYYFAAKDADELSKIFEKISDSIDETTTTVTLDGNAVMRDIIADEFILPEDFSIEGNVTCQTADYQGNGTWAESVAAEGVTASVANGNTINVSGFSYKDHYVTEAGAETSAQGKKLVVTITGILAKDGIHGTEINTNKAESGIYPDNSLEAEIVKAFPQPKVNIPQNSYVLDYGKKVNVAKKEVIGENATALALDNGFKKQNINQYSAGGTGAYGSAALDDTNITYAPGKINWDGADNFGVLAQLTAEDRTANYEWSSVSFIPANNVYFEDNFASTSNDTSGDVKIVYSKGNWETVGTDKQETTQESTNTIYGKDASYENEKEYSNGSAQAGTSGATATFNFTGTGVDIYSSTDSNACVVNAYLYNADGKMIKYAVCNNYGADGKYYTVPTVAFTNLDHGQYTVKLRVMKNQTITTDDTTQHYYLDGIRVYNPLGNVTDDGTVVGDAYKEAGELNAVFKEIRSMLLDGTSTVDGEGMLYFDQIADNKDHISNSPTTYESQGPEHEAYLSQGNGVAFTMTGFDEGDAVYVGIKLVKAGSANGKVQVTNGADTSMIDINSTADTYYKIIPDASGNVAIKNVGDAVVSVTKVRTTSPGTNDIQFVSSTDTTVAYISTFNSLALTDYNEEIQEPGDENGIIQEPDDGNDADSEEGGDVVIEDSDDSTDSETEPADRNDFKDIFNRIKNWFGKRR